MRRTLGTLAGAVLLLTAFTPHLANQSPPRNPGYAVAVVADTAFVTGSWSPGAGNFDGYAATLAMSGLPLQRSPKLPTSARSYTFRVVRGSGTPPTNGQFCALSMRGTRDGGSACLPVVITWPEPPIPVPEMDSVVVTVPDIGAAPPDTVPPDSVIVIPPDTAVVRQGVAELPRVFLDTRYPTTLREYLLSASGNLQTALDTAKRGDRILLPAGATYTGNFVLRAKPGTAPIVLETAAPLPPEGTRMTPTQAGVLRLAKILTTNSMPALRTAAGADASHYRLTGVEITSTAAMTYSIVHMGDYDNTATTVEMLPASLVIDRAYVHGSATNGIQRCITMHAKAGAVIDSWVSDCHINGFDSQSIVSWLSPGPLKFVNNHLEGAGENLMIGGADPRIPGLIGSDIEIRRNHFYKPLSWKASGAWTVKNSFELKNARRVLVEANVFENNWSGGQTGFAIVLKSINDGGKCTWCETSHVTFRHNRIINAPGGIHMVAVQAYNGGGAIPMNRVVVDQVDMVGVGYPTDGPQVSGATYQMFQLNGNLTSMHISNVTSLAESKQIIMFTGAPTTDTRFVRNVVGKTMYGIFGDGRGEGLGAIGQYAPGSVIAGNVLLGANCGIYPAGNVCPAAPLLATDAGVDVAELDRRLAGVVVPR